MPKPKEGEPKEEFMSRCIPIVLNDGTAEDNAQAAEVCGNMYDKKSLPCTDCEGIGRVKTVTSNSEGGTTNSYSDCVTCNGTGEVE